MYSNTIITHIERTHPPFNYLLCALLRFDVFLGARFSGVPAERVLRRKDTGETDGGLRISSISCNDNMSGESSSGESSVTTDPSDLVRLIGALGI